MIERLLRIPEIRGSNPNISKLNLPTVDLGSGVANLTTKEKVELNQWNVVRITRNGVRGTLQLNEGPIVGGSSPGSLSELNLDMPLYLGGFR